VFYPALSSCNQGVPMSRPSYMRILLMMVVAVLGAAGCGAKASGGGAGGEPEPLRGKAFVLESATEHGKPYAIVSGTTVELRFTADGRLVANAGCNVLSGPATVSGDLFDADLSATEKACDEPRHAQDVWLSTFLGSRPAWRMDGDRLTLSSPDTELVLAPQKTVPLHDTPWTITTLIDGQSAGGATTEATLTFGDGEVTVTGLCNLKTVAYEESGTTLTFQLGPMTRMMCAPEIMTVENAAVRVLDGAATYELDGTTLTITNGDHSLQLTAE